MSRTPVIGYLLKTFPKLSETFILNEILELERQGVSLHIFSLRPPQDHHRHPGVSRVKAPVTYIPSILPGYNLDAKAVLLEHHKALLDQFPVRYTETLEFHLRCPEEKHINEFLQGVYLATQLTVLGIKHLHVHFANIPTTTAEIAQKFSGVTYSITAHAKDIYLSNPAVLDRRFANAEFVLTCTDYNRQYLEALSTSKTPIYRSYHGIDLNQFSQSRRSNAPSISIRTDRERHLELQTRSTIDCQPSVREHPPLKLLSVGRFCEKKGFSYLLRACHQLKRDQIPVDCRIVGYGPLRSQLEAQIRELNLSDSVMLMGQLTQDQVIEQYRWAEVFVLPCLVARDGDRDGIPNVLLEAMAMGVPVISTKISGITELIQSRHNGLLVPEKSVVELTAAIALLTQTSNLRARLGSAGQATVTRQFALERNIGQVKDLLLRTLTRPPTNSAHSLSPSLEALIS